MVTLNLTDMTREDAIHNISTAFGEPEEIDECRANSVEIHASLPIINIYGDGSHLIAEKPRRKSYQSPYAKFDKLRKKRK